MTQGERFVDALGHEFRRQLGRVQRSMRAGRATMLGLVRDPAGLVRGTAESAASVGRLLRPVSEPLSPILRGRSLSLRLDTLALSTEKLRAAAKLVDGKLNDAFVAGVAGGLRLYHEAHKAPVENLRMTMPINVREGEKARVAGNQFVPARFSVPVGIREPRERMAAIRDLVAGQRAEPALAMMDDVSGVLNRLPTAVTTSLFGSMLKGVDFVTSNVPGPRFDVYLSGAKLESVFGFGPLTGAAINVTLFSYTDRSHLGIASDPASVPDPDLLIACMQKGFDEVLTGVCRGARMPRPFRFAVQSFSASSAKEWRERARKAEAIGYSALHLADHILGPGPAIASTNHPIQELAAVPAMMMAAEATTRLRVGCRVFGVDHRQPAMLAKEAATIDLLSDGRLELGLGAGWLAAEYEAIGIRFDPAPVRIARLAETVGALKALFSGEQVSYDGNDVRLHGFAGRPIPVQKPHPPIMIGGGGRRVLSLAARQAEIVSFNFNNRAGVIGSDGVKNSTADETARKVAWVRDAAGERFDALELEIGAYFTFVGDRAREIAGGMAGAFGLTADEMMHHPHALFGTPDAICEELERRRDAYGISYVTVPDTALDAFAPVVAKLTGT